MEKIRDILYSHPFITPKFLQDPGLQTFIARLIPHFKTKLPKKERIYIKLIDGSNIAADYWIQKNKKKHSTIIILGGLDGYQKSGRSSYADHVTYKAYYHGYNVIQLKQKGEGDIIHLTKSLFSSYPVEEIEAALKAFNSLGFKNFYITGVSGGGWVALFTAIKLKPKLQKQILGVISIGAPINFFSAWEHVKNKIIYRWVLLSLYKNLVIRRIKIDPKGTWDIKKLKKIKSLREWGQLYIPKFTKFTTIDEYHKATDLTPQLSKLKIPTLIIHAKSDPMIPFEPFSKINNPFIIKFFPDFGGHSGFITTKKFYGDLDGHWAENRTIEFIKLLETKRKQNL